MHACFAFYVFYVVVDVAMNRTVDDSWRAVLREGTPIRTYCYNPLTTQDGRLEEIVDTIDPPKSTSVVKLKKAPTDRKKTYTLNIRTVPSDARIRILNISPKYKSEN